MTYDELRQGANRGWNTWFSPSMTTHALLPCGFAIGLCFRDYADARLIPVVETITPETMALCGGAGTARGTGGMLTKVHAAKTATERGIPVVVMNGSDPQALYRVLDGDSIGTLFLGK